MKIFLTKRAERNFFSIKSKISTEWGEDVADLFEEKITDFLDLIINYPEIGISEVAKKKIRSFQITKQTRIFYRIKKDKIIILAFFDVRQDPTRKPT